MTKETGGQVDTLVKEEVKFDIRCHTFPTINGKYTGFSYCGVPRCEQPEHGILRARGTYKNYKFCPYCGVKKCAICGSKG